MSCSFLHRRPAVAAAAGVLIVAAIVAAVVAVPDAALAAPAGGLQPVAAPVTSLTQVITNLRAWLMGILGALATLFLVVGGVYWATAGGDPAQVDRAKQAFRNALIGYGLAVLAPLFLQVLQGIVGG